MSLSVGGPLTQNMLTVLGGARAIGKTHWIDLMLEKYSDQLRRVKTCTTRPWREPSDNHSYEFLTEAEFQDRVASGWFLEHDPDYKQFRYGSSLHLIRPVLQATHGILALTPPGLEAIWRHRHEFPLRIVVFLPESRAMALRNVQRRNIDPPEKWDKLADEAMAWRPPSSIECTVLTLTGDDERDMPQVVPALAPPA